MRAGYFGWVGVSESVWDIIMGGNEWGWVYCLIMPIKNSDSPKIDPCGTLILITFNGNLDH